LIALLADPEYRNGAEAFGLASGSTGDRESEGPGEDVAEGIPEPILSEVGDRVNAAWGDFDNDGYLDLLVEGERNRLWRNLGDGNFEEIFRGSPVSDSCDNAATGGWVDFNADGFLDLFVPNIRGCVNFL